MQLLILHFQNLIELVIKQNKTKEYQKFLEKKYKPACKVSSLILSTITTKFTGP